MSDQNSAPQQVEEAAATNVQPDAVVEPVANNKVVEPESTPVDGSKSEETAAEPAVEAKESKPMDDSEKQAEKKDEPVAEAEKPSSEDKADVADDKSAVEPDSKSDLVTVEQANGDSGEAIEKKADEPAADAPAAEETNGICKRKAENGAADDVVEDEKTPKKAKVVDDGDQAPVEETAA